MRLALVVTLVNLSALGSIARAQTQIASLAGNPGDQFGAAVISAGFQDADTYADLLVGSPAIGTGNIRCISGRYLAMGVGSSTLWMVNGPVNPPAVTGGGFGTSIAAVGNLTGNSATDFVVGSPFYKFNPFGAVNGAVHLVDGSTHAVVATIYGSNDTQLGTVVVSVGDQDGDGKVEIAATAPAANSTSASHVHVIKGSAFSGTKSLGNAAHSSLNSNGANEFGETIASGFDLDGDGKRDLAIGSPRMLGTGWMQVVRADNFATLAAYSGANGGEHMGASISASHDYNGDGVVDFVVGAPNWSTDHATADGRAVVLSGANLRSFTLPYELATYSLTTGGVATYLFGAAVRASPDLNSDGVGDFLIGAPKYSSLFPANSDKGAVFVYSGATLSKIATIIGASNDRLGDELLGGFQDVTSDLFPEFVVAGSLSDSPVTDCGVIKLYSLFPLAPTSYCVGKLNSLGCTPAMSSSGSPSASSSAPFTLTCANVINQVSGLFFYSSQPTAVSFQGGTLCVQSPLKRSAVQASGGSASGADCTGAFTWDFGARIQSGVDPALVAGAEVFVQCWSRDSASPSTTSLSNGRRFFINP